MVIQKQQPKQLETNNNNKNSDGICKYIWYDVINAIDVIISLLMNFLHFRIWRVIDIIDNSYVDMYKHLYWLKLLFFHWWIEHFLTIACKQIKLNFVDKISIYLYASVCLTNIFYNLKFSFDAVAVAFIFSLEKNTQKSVSLKNYLLNVFFRPEILKDNYIVFQAYSQGSLTTVSGNYQIQEVKTLGLRLTA